MILNLYEISYKSKLTQTEEFEYLSKNHISQLIEIFLILMKKFAFILDCLQWIS